MVQKQFSKLGINTTTGNFKIVYAVILLLVALAAYRIYSDVFSANVSLKYENENAAFINVSSSKNYNSLINQLKKGRYLKNIESFERLSQLLKLQKKMKPGRYKLVNGMTNFQLLNMIIKGRQEPLNLVFNYAERKQDFSAFVGRHLEADSTILLHLLNDTGFVRKLGFDTNTVLCMFIPNTYNFYWNTSAKDFIIRMQQEYQKFWTQERLAKALKMGLSATQVSILASIVQKETNKADEMPIVAGVYVNRLRRAMPLQADPTLIYAWNDKEIRRVTNVHTALNSPYNTYLNVGLTPGPICIPSIISLDAVLNHTEHEYLFFCAREDFSGYHAFAETLVQHTQNARRYQRALNKANIY
jgi:UPF0755 protein